LLAVHIKSALKNKVKIKYRLFQIIFQIKIYTDGVVITGSCGARAGTVNGTEPLTLHRARPVALPL
jgi:hypothetical protein